MPALKAYVLNKAGGTENLILSKIERPTPEVNEVLVETKAISINPVDVKVRPVEEVLNMIVGSERPVILGWDIAGTVASVGDSVTQFKIGDSVFGMVNFPGHGKAYAEQGIRRGSRIVRSEWRHRTIIQSPSTIY